MHRRLVSGWSFSVLAIAAVLLPAAGCTMANMGASTFGGSPKQVAEISNIGSYTADGALMEARGHFRNNDFGYSAALYKRAVELSPKDTEGYAGLAASYDRLRRFDLADRVYESWFKLSGGTVQYYNNVGYSNMLRGNLSAALSNFRKAQTLAPDSPVVANNLQILADAMAAARA